jgi:hypothetical protein
LVIYTTFIPVEVGSTVSSIKDYTKNDISIVLIQETNAKLDKFDYFMNLLLEPPAKKAKTSSNLDPQPEVFFCISIPNKTLFLDEFYYGLLNQDYPKNKLNLHITAKNKGQVKTARQFFSGTDYK